MIITQNNVIFKRSFSLSASAFAFGNAYLSSSSNTLEYSFSIKSKRNDFSDKSMEKQKQKPSFQTTFFTQSLVSVLALGFVDAGYSGDWSRIGVISKETEDLLKLAAFLVLPISIFIVFYLSKKTED